MLHPCLCPWTVQSSFKLVGQYTVVPYHGVVVDGDTEKVTVKYLLEITFVTCLALVCQLDSMYKDFTFVLYQVFQTALDSIGYDLL